MTLEIAVAQHDARLHGPDERFEWLEQAASDAAKAGSGLVVFPELYLSGYNVGQGLRDWAEPADGAFAQKVAALARKLGIAILYGYPEQTAEGIYNSAVCLDATGAMAAHHRKTILPPGIEPGYFQTGEGLTMFRLGALTLALVICYECEFPEIVRSLSAKGADAVLVCTACSWSQVPDFLVPTRAFENGVYMVYANHAGPENGIDFPGRSCIIDPFGRELARARAGAEVISAKLDPAVVAAAQDRLPYLRDYQKLSTTLALPRSETHQKA